MYDFRYPGKPYLILLQPSIESIKTWSGFILSCNISEITQKESFLRSNEKEPDPELFKNIAE